MQAITRGSRCRNTTGVNCLNTRCISVTQSSPCNLAPAAWSAPLVGVSASCCFDTIAAYSITSCSVIDLRCMHAVLHTLRQCCLPPDFQHLCCAVAAPSVVCPPGLAGLRLLMSGGCCACCCCCCCELSRPGTDCCCRCDFCCCSCGGT